MANFKTDKEARKWATLSAAISKPLSKMAEGKALPEDLKTISQVLESYDALAAELFARSLESVDLLTHDLADKKNRELIQLGKSPMTQAALEKFYKQTYQEVLAASKQDIEGILQDHFSGAVHEIAENIADTVSENVGEDVKTELKDAFTKVKDLVQNQPTKKRKESDSEDSTNTEPASESGLQRFIKTIRKLKHFIEAKPVTVDGTTYKSRTEYHHALGYKSNKDVVDSVLRLNAQDPSLRKKTPIAKQVHDALLQNQRTRDKLNKEWSSLKRGSKSWDWTAKVKGFFKANKTWLDNNWLINKYRTMRYAGATRTLVHGFQKTKSAAKSIMRKGSGVLKKSQSLMETLGPAILLSLMAPQFISGIATKVGEVLNFKNISDFVSNTWKSVQDGASDAVDWVIKKIKSWFSDDDDEEDKKETARIVAEAKAKGRVLTPEQIKQAKVAGSVAKMDATSITQGKSVVSTTAPQTSAPSSTTQASGSMFSSMPNNSVAKVASLAPTASRDNADRDNRELKLLEGYLASAKERAAKATAAGQPVPFSAATDIKELPKRIAEVKTRRDARTAQMSGAPSAPSGSSMPASTTTLSTLQPASTSAPATSVSAVNSVSDTPGIVAPQPDTQPAQQQPAVAANQSRVSGNSVSLSSIDMRPGGDHLYMYNLGVLT